MKFSIVIPAFNEEKTVKHSIGALLKQSVPRKDFEIIVVDNNSKDKTSTAAKKAGADKVVLEKEPGTNFARQKGVDVSKGKIIVFLDADSKPPKDWLNAIEKILKRDNLVGVSGPYKYGKAFPDFVAKMIYPTIAKIVPIITGLKGGVMLGGNMAIYKSAIDKIGGLPPVRFYGDDTAIAVLLARRAGNVLYTPEIWVESSPRRFDKKGVIKTGLRYIYHFFKVYFAKRYR